ncbi:unnamed protein product [Caenorhabditis auriculariae]|uniref:Uncharacterized protein n=1 Tax=Caenorhabditis auriculariae TaxID=2777116 RepID=A0A8S1HTA9_9PELO|nr:unnamed protein product [Caenorhabditis auriculariae]
MSPCEKGVSFEDGDILFRLNIFLFFIVFACLLICFAVAIFLTYQMSRQHFEYKTAKKGQSTEEKQEKSQSDKEKNKKKDNERNKRQTSTKAMSQGSKILKVKKEGVSDSQSPIDTLPSHMLPTACSSSEKGSKVWLPVPPEGNSPKEHSKKISKPPSPNHSGKDPCGSSKDKVPTNVEKDDSDVKKFLKTKVLSNPENVEKDDSDVKKHLKNKVLPNPENEEKDDSDRGQIGQRSRAVCLTCLCPLFSNRSLKRGQTEKEQTGQHSRAVYLTCLRPLLSNLWCKESRPVSILVQLSSFCLTCLYSLLSNRSLKREREQTGQHSRAVFLILSDSSEFSFL